MKKHFSLLICLGAAVLLGLTSCEKADFDDEDTPATEEPTTAEPVDEGDANLVIRVSNTRVFPFEKRNAPRRAVENLVDYCSRLNFVIYKDGEKVVGKSQLKGDADYGQVALSLTPGTYKLMVLAHSSYGGNPVVSDPENIQFTNKLSYSDTFYYYGDIEVTKEAKVHDIVLLRATTRVNFTINDELPAELATIEFFYTGGTGVLNAVTGYGADVNSQQTKRYNVTGYKAPLSMSIYTFLKGDTGKLNLRVSALDKDDNVIMQKEFENVPVERNKVTEMEGDFFVTESQNTFSLTGETGWDVLQHLTY
jgi:hypothetical protein